MTNFERIQKLQIMLDEVEESIAELKPKSIAYLVNVDDRVKRAYTIIAEMKRCQANGLDNEYEPNLAEQLFNDGTIIV